MGKNITLTNPLPITYSVKAGKLICLGAGLVTLELLPLSGSSGVVMGERLVGKDLTQDGKGWLGKITNLNTVVSMGKIVMCCKVLLRVALIE